MEPGEEKGPVRGSRYVYQSKHDPSARSPKSTSCCSKICSCVFSPIGLCILLIIYGVIGAFTFRAFEMGSSERERPRYPFDMAMIREDAISRVWNITMEFNILYQPNWTRKVTDEILKFEKDIIKVLKTEFSKKESPPKPKWTFFRSLLYSLTLVTTIGKLDQSS